MNHTLRIICKVIYLVLFCSPAFAQEENPEKPVKPGILEPESSAVAAASLAGGGIGAQSPESYTQNRLQDIAVNLYTGTPLINIPLYTLQEGNITLPISLSYNATGVRVNDPASWCGQNWSLNAGGMITRLVRGLPDEGTADGVLRKGYYDVGYNGGVIEDDHEPDQYMLSINGSSYRFCFNHAKEIHFFPEVDIKVEPRIKTNRANNQIKWFSEWVVTMPDGMKYYFGSPASNTTDRPDYWEYTISKELKQSAPSSGDFAKANPTSWYLRRVETPQGQAMSLNYNYIYYSYLQLAETEKDKANGTITQYINRVYVASPVLTEIVGLNTTIKFYKETLSTCFETDPITNESVPVPCNSPNLYSLRQDLMNWANKTASYSRILENMVVESAGKKLMYSFNYGYFSGNYSGGGNSLLPNYTYQDIGSAHLKRLKLNKITFPNGTSYDFQYHYDDPSVSFPGTIARGVDHWGYPNGVHGASHLIGAGECQALGGWETNRDASNGWNLYGSLRKITSSTGTETEFTYSGHYAFNYGSMVGGIRVTRISTKDLITNQYIIKEYDYNQFGTSTTSGFLLMKPVYRYSYPNASGPEFGYNSYLYSAALARSGRPVVGYRNVKEITYAGSINIDQFLSNQNKDTYRTKTIAYTFDQDESEVNVCNNDDGFSYKPWKYRPDIDYRSGNPLKIEEYGKNGSLIGTSINEYGSGIGSGSTYYSTNVARYNGKVGGGFNESYGYYYMRYGIAKTINRSYDFTGINYVESTVEYIYKDQMDSYFQGQYPGKHYMPVKTKTTDSRGYSIETETHYVGDFAIGNEPADAEAKAIYQLLQRNMRGLPIESITRKNNKVISASYVSYKTSLNLPESSYQLRYFPLTDFSPAIWNGSSISKDSRYQLMTTNESYSSLGFATSVKQNFGIRTRTAFTNYNGLLPTQIIQNADVTDSQTSAYEYSVPMFGISKQVMPNGFETRSEYEDQTGRLRKVSNHNGQIIQYMEYKSKGQ